IDVYVISGEAAHSAQPPVAQSLLRMQNPIHWMLYLKALIVVLICSLLAGLVFPFLAATNVVMFYLVGIVVVPVRYGRGPSVLASLVSVLAYDFLFVPPHLTFAVSDTQYLITFAVMLLVGLRISGMTVRIREKAEIAAAREPP